MSPARAAARALRRSDGTDERAERVRRRQHLQVVDAPSPSRRRSKRHVVTGVAVLLTVFLALLGLVVFHTVLVQNQSKIDGLDEHLILQREEIKDRRLAIAELESPERVIAVAESQGLVAPDEVVMLDAVQPQSVDPAVEPGPTSGSVPRGEQAAGAPDAPEATP